MSPDTICSGFGGFLALDFVIVFRIIIACVRPGVHTGARGQYAGVQTAGRVGIKG